MENKSITKTKILATVGPASSDEKIIKNLIIAGVDGFRFNFSHGKIEELTDTVKIIRKVSKELNVNISILGDLQGPKIRIGEIQKGSVEIKKGEFISITSKPVIGNEKVISSGYRNLYKDAKVGDCILIDDGLIKLQVKKINFKTQTLYCEVIDGGILKSRKGMNLPNTKLNTSAITDSDLRNLEFAIKNSLDFIALSFVRNSKDVIRLKNEMIKRGAQIPVISKIELKEGVKNFEEILSVSDGIMVARGDLGVELESQEVPVCQKKFIKRCNEERKLVITATQMLESMVNNPLPTRAEASDVANAVFDGTDVVMLSAETSVGKNPVRTVEIMNKILKRAEEGLEELQNVQFSLEPNDQKIIHAVAKAVTIMADQINAKAIIPITHSGYTAIILSKYKPFCKILAITRNSETCRRLNLYRAVRAYQLKGINNLDSTIKSAKNILLKAGELNIDDEVVFVGGLTTTNKGFQNLIKIEKI